MAEPGAPADLAVRRRAIDPRRSFCVSAPAGSGKTELLAQRLLALLAVVNQPEEILAVTFTRKAAGEMRARTMDALRAAGAPRAPGQGSARLAETAALAERALARDRAAGWQLLENPNRLRVQTVDGFCRHLAERCPLSSGTGAGLAVGDRPGPLYRAAVRELFTELESGPEAVAAALESLLVALDNRWERLEGLLVEMLARREQWLPLLGTGGVGGESVRAALERGRAALIVDSLSATRDQLKFCLEPLAGLLDFALANGLVPASPAPPGAGLQPTPEALARWRALAGMLLTKDTGGVFRRSLGKREGFPDDGEGSAKKKELKELLEQMTKTAGLATRLASLRTLPEPRYLDAEWQRLEGLTTLLPRLASHLQVVFLRAGEADFTEFALAAERALGDMDGPSELAMQLGYRLRHILVDEFQDTSRSQFRLFETLVEGWAEDNVAEPVDPKTVFVVGDAMQSCYGFRQADVGLFLRARHAGIAGMRLEDVSLSVNFRSRAELVGWVNEHLESAFPVEDFVQGDVGYMRSSPSPAALSESERPPIGEVVHVFAATDAALARASEADWVVAELRRLRTERPDEDIAVLARNRAHLAALLPALRAAGLSWHAEDLNPLSRCVAVGDLMSMTRALLDPGDRIAWLALLRAPWCGLDNAALHALVGGQPSGVAVWSRIEAALAGELPRLDAEARARLRCVHAALAPALAARQRAPLRRWALDAWRALGGPMCLGADESWRDVESCLGMLEEADSGGDCPDWLALEERLGGFAESGDAPSAGLQLMTIHKAKGLEFDNVFVLGLNESRPRDNKPLLLWRERLLSKASRGDTPLLMASLAGAIDEEDSLYSFLRAEAKRRQRQEETRLLYVAATRARRALWLCATAALDDEGEVRWRPAGMLAAMEPSRLDEARVHVAAFGGPPAAKRPVAEARSWLRRLPLDSLAQRVSAPSDAGARVAIAGDAGARASWRQAGAVEHRAVGEVVHAAMEWLAERADDAPPPGRPAWRGLLRQHGLSGETLERGVERVAAIVERALSDERGRWLLSSARLEAASELAVIHRGQRMVIDRSFVDDDGTRWLIEYKTTAPEPGAEADLERFAVEAAERHRQQVRGYAEALRALHGEPVRCALYFPAVPLFCPLDEAGAPQRLS